MNDEPLIGTFCQLFEEGDTTVELIPEDFDRLDAGMQEYIDGFGQKDVVIHLTRLNGSRYCVLASLVRSWCLSTPESRTRERALVRAAEAEAERGTWGE